MSSIIPFRHASFLKIAPFNFTDLTIAGEVTIERPDFRVAGDTRTFTSQGLTDDGNADWINGGAVGGAPTVFPVSRGYKVVITSIVFGAHDVNFPRMNVYREHEEATNGMYGEGVRWTIRRGTGAGVQPQPVQPYASMNYAWGDGYGQHDALLGGAPSGEAIWTWEPTNRCYVEFGTDQFMTISMRRRTDPRATGALYLGAGTKMFPITNIAILEYTVVVQGAIVPSSFDLRTFPRRERFHSELSRYRMADKAI